jgi:hypothetical protein
MVCDKECESYGTEWKTTLCSRKFNEKFMLVAAKIHQSSGKNVTILIWSDSKTRLANSSK